MPIVLYHQNLSNLKCLVYFRDGQCCEYSAEDHAICAVGSVRPKPGIFVEAIQYLLVIATPVEVRKKYSMLMFFRLNNL